MKEKRFRIYTNALFHKITNIYAVVLITMGFMACYLAYSKEHSMSMSQRDQVMKDLHHEYKSCTEDFWRLYMPIFENVDSVYVVLRKYFIMEDKSTMKPIEKLELVNALQTIMGNDNRIQWIGLYAGKGENNHILFAGESSLVEMPVDFPFIEDMEKKGISMEVYGSKLIEHRGVYTRNFALCGGTPTDMRRGKIIVGYDTNNIASAYTVTEEMENVRFYVVNDKGIVYDSANIYECEYSNIREDSYIACNQEGKLIYLRKLPNTGANYSVFCEEPWINMILKSHSYTPYIGAMMLLFWAFSLWIYRWTGKIIIGKIDAIQLGLEKIGDNELDYRIPVPEIPTDEFESIGQSVNEVTVRLQDNINKAYQSKLKQREAELAELQAKFDPHFLYNTLEIIRGRVYENGDDETADIIVKLAQIFRSFIGSERFVSIQEEMEFCNLYLSLLKYRYDNQVMIIYDVDSNILSYGIIRNLLQPILENYFVHGFQAGKQDNRLTIRGKLQDDMYVRFLIKDNGIGITENRLEELKDRLDTIEPSGKSSYGLKNINKRIKLFYGQDCGLSIDRNEEGGATIEVRIMKLTCEEHESRMYGVEGSKIV